jgi:uncharacterized protein (TIGR02270 family)
MELQRPALMLDILEEHFEELDFLWEQRESVLFEAGWTLKELGDIEERADAHLAGLRVGAAHTMDLARPALAGGSTSAATAAAFALMALGDPELEKEVVMALAATSPQAREGIRIALRHSDVSRISERLGQTAAAGDPQARAAAADVLAFHRLAPPPRFAELFAVPEPVVRRLVYGAAGRFGGPWSLDYLQGALRGEDVGVQKAALEASARLGLPLLIESCRRAAMQPQSAPQSAVVFLGVLGDVQDLQLLQGAARIKPLAPAAIEGLGALGRIAAIPLLIQAMRDPALTRAAGAAFVRITGATGIEADHPLPPPPDLPEEEKEFWDESRPPDPDRALAYWDKAKSGFTSEGRWQAGREVSQAPLGDGFDALPLPIRRDIYLSARARDPIKTPDLELEKRASRQRGDMCCS